MFHSRLYQTELFCIFKNRVHNRFCCYKYPLKWISTRSSTYKTMRMWIVNDIDTKQLIELNDYFIHISLNQLFFMIKMKIDEYFAWSGFHIICIWYGDVSILFTIKVCSINRFFLINMTISSSPFNSDDFTIDWNISAAHKMMLMDHRRV